MLVSATREQPDRPVAERTHVATGVDGRATAASQLRWQLARRSVAVLAIAGGAIGGIRLHGAHGPVRTRWLELLADAHADTRLLRTIPPHATVDRLTGGLDLAETLKAGRTIREPGLLDVPPRHPQPSVAFIISGLERQPAANCALIVQALDRLVPHVSAVAVDESEPSDQDEAARRISPDGLSDRLGIWLSLDGIGARQAMANDDQDLAVLDPAVLTKARARFANVAISDAHIESVCAVAARFGVVGIRAVMAAVACARAAAAAADRRIVTDPDVELAAQLVIIPRATRQPSAEPDDPQNDENEQAPEPDTRDAPDPPSSSDERQPSELTERIIAATASALPENVLAEIASGLRKTSGQLKSGQSGATVKRAKRGRAYGAQTGDPSGNDRLNLIETLRAAAPWQPLRRAAVAHSRNGKSVRKDNSSQALPKVLVRRSDFRIYRREERSETLAIFVVDASGSSAVQRLAETKGAIEVMLGESYSRRDHVSVVAVRGRAADVLMPPTRSLTRARRQLAGLPGGGGTPLASGLEQAFAIADHARRRGQQPMVIVLTDGQANIDRTGTPGRRAAEADAHAAAHMLRAVGVPSVLIDTANRAQPRAKAIADAMGARYIAMPRADGAGVAAAARGAMSTSQTTSASGGRG